MKLLEHFKELSLHPKNAQELKGLVLQLAVQGKLTANWREENPDVEPASEILKIIEAEKGLQSIDNKVPYKLTSTWRWAKFTDVASLRHGHQFRKYDFVEEGIPVIKIGQCKSDGTLDFSKCNYIDSSRKEEFKNDLIFKGHLLMALTGGTLGKVTRVDKDYGLLVQNYRVGNFFADERVLSLDFLNVILESELFQGLVRERINQNAQPNIGKDNIEKILMPIPPLEEQKAIVEVVNTLFAEVKQLESLTKERIELKDSFVVSELNRLTKAENIQEEWNFLQEHFSSFFTKKKNIKSLRETILQLAVQGKLTESWRANNPNIEPASELLKRIEYEKQQLIAEKKIKKEKPYDPIEPDGSLLAIPKIWGYNYIRDISSVVTCGMASTPTYTETGRMFLSAKNVKPFTFKPENHKFVSEETYQKIIKNSKPEKGDLLLTRVGAGIGEACVIDQDLDFAFYVSLTLIKPMEGINSHYMLYWLSSQDGIAKVLDNIYGRGVSQGNLNVNQVRQFVIPIPPLEEQKAIVEKVNSLMVLCDELEQQIETSQTQIEQLMQSCLKEVFQQESN